MLSGIIGALVICIFYLIKIVLLSGILLEFGLGFCLID